MDPTAPHARVARGAAIATKQHAASRPYQPERSGARKSQPAMPRSAAIIEAMSRPPPNRPDPAGHPSASIVSAGVHEPASNECAEDGAVASHDTAATNTAP